jgi:hypothetical protein
VRVDGTIAKIAPKERETTGMNHAVAIDLAQIPEGLAGHEGAGGYCEAVAGH